ncbi:MAG: hypothetical protein VX976_03005 [Pseudomonadota bacterium]|nr:hypothetical protein [Pseudomonadota bacterium]
MLNIIARMEIIKFRLANDKPKNEKIISSHLVIGTCSRKFLRSSTFIKLLSVDIHPISYFTKFLSTRL